MKSEKWRVRCCDTFFFGLFWTIKKLRELSRYCVGQAESCTKISVLSAPSLKGAKRRFWWKIELFFFPAPYRAGANGKVATLFARIRISRIPGLSGILISNDEVRVSQTLHNTTRPIHRKGAKRRPFFWILVRKTAFLLRFGFYYYHSTSTNRIALERPRVFAYFWGNAKSMCPTGMRSA